MWPVLNDRVQHPVVEAGDGARVLALDSGEDPVDVGVGAETDALEAVVGLARISTCTVGARPEADAVDVADRPAPVVDRGAGCGIR